MPRTTSTTGRSLDTIKGHPEVTSRPTVQRPARFSITRTPLYASLLIKHGESVKTVSERLGHTNAAMTLNIYTHLWPDSEERTRAAVDKAYADQSADAQPQVDEAA